MTSSEPPAPINISERASSPPILSPRSSTSSSSSSKTPRHHNRSNSETLHQTEPFQEEWQDTPETQQELIQNFRRGVETIRENVGAIRERPMDEEKEEKEDEEEEENLDKEVYDDDYWVDEADELAPQSKRNSRLVSSAGPSKRQSTYDATQNLKIRDFAYPASSPLHYGLPLTPTTPTAIAATEFLFAERDDIFVNRRARALFDFEAENPSEASLQEGQIFIVQYRQCPGWLVADVNGQIGLVPESWVEVLGKVEAS